jgi:hypothetical protein
MSFAIEALEIVFASSVAWVLLRVDCEASFQAITSCAEHDDSRGILLRG